MADTYEDYLRKVRETSVKSLDAALADAWAEVSNLSAIESPKDRLNSAMFIIKMGMEQVEKPKQTQAVDGELVIRWQK
jgi:hypothetical protein